ncbi:hypothetical protein [Azorhizobium caulinodans]
MATIRAISASSSPDCRSTLVRKLVTATPGFDGRYHPKVDLCVN